MHVLSPRTRRIFGLTLVASFAVATFSFAQGEGGAAPTPPKKPTTAWDIIKHGGPSLVLLGICSVGAVTLIIERFMYYRKAGGNADEILDKVKQAGTMSEALAAIEHAPGVSGTVFRSTLQAARDGYTPEQIEQLTQGYVTKELINMEKFLPQLDTLVTMCPLIGLAGTTIGMIKSFAKVAEIGMSDPTQLAGGISEALVNTAGGLLVAIPALFAYNWFTGKKEAILMEMEKGLSELMVILKSSAGHWTFSHELKRRKIKRGRVEIIPMIDTIVILLIFYMTFSRFVDAARENLELPPAKAGEELKIGPGQVIVNLAKSGEFSVDKQPYQLTELPGLMERYRRTLPADQKITIILRADKTKIKYKDLSEFMNACSKAKITDVTFATTEGQ